eukprot:g6343.t1
MMMTATLASCWILMLAQDASGWGTTRIITAATPSSSSSKTPAFFAPTTTRFANVNQQRRDQHRRLAGLARSSSTARGRDARKAAPRARTALACRSDTPVDEAPLGDRDRVWGKTTNMNVLVGSLTAAWSAFPAGAWAAAAAIAGDAGGMEMGARLDAPAAISFGSVMAAFAFLQARVRTAVRARTARRDYEVLFKGMKARQLAGQADEDEVALVEERMAQLLREEQEARMVDIFGVPFNLVIPEGGAGGEQGTGARESQQGRSGSTNAFTGGGVQQQQQQQQRQLGIREARKAKAESDLLDGRAREEEMSPGATLKVAALWLVLISQLTLKKKLAQSRAETRKEKRAGRLDHFLSGGEGVERKVCSCVLARPQRNKAAGAAAAAAMGDRDTPSSCLFVSDLPSDITEKELERLFAGCHGFESCRVRKDKNEHDVGFVDFWDTESATNAKDRFKGQDVRGHTIAVCYARPARKRQRPERQDTRDMDLGGDSRNYAVHRRTPSGGGLTTSLPGVNAGYLSIGGIGSIPAAPAAYGIPTPRLMQMSAMGLPLGLPNDAHHTLYVEGVPGDVSERELAHIFRPFPGYISLRLRAKGGRSLAAPSSSSANVEAICFVEFESSYHATIAKMGAADYRLDKVDRNSPILRIEYAKAKNGDRGGGGRGRDRGGGEDRDRGDRDRY